MRTKGFTLLELIVVMVIVGILASVSIPMIQANTKRAILAEAIAGLGVIKVLQDAYYAEHSEYQDVPVNWFIGRGGNYPNGVYAGDFNGTFFSETMYMLDTGKYLETGQRYVGAVMIVSLNPTAVNTAPKAAEVLSTFGATTHRYLVMMEDGEIYQEDLPETGFPDAPAF